jgi:hypothetical protein
MGAASSHTNFSRAKRPSVCKRRAYVQTRWFGPCCLAVTAFNKLFRAEQRSIIRKSGAAISGLKGDPRRQP